MSLSNWRRRGSFLAFPGDEADIGHGNETFVTDIIVFQASDHHMVDAL